MQLVVIKLSCDPGSQRALIGCDMANGLCSLIWAVPSMAVSIDDRICLTLVDVMLLIADFESFLVVPAVVVVSGRRYMLPSGLFAN